MIRRLAAALGLAALALTAFLVSGGPLPAQDLGAENPTRIVKAAFEPANVTRGGVARLVIEIGIDPGWHVYAQDAADEQKPFFAWTLPAGWSAEKVEDVSKPHVFTGFGSEEHVHEGKAVLAVIFRVGADAATGPATITGTGEWQVCNDQMCQYAKGVPVSATAEVAAAGGAAAGAGAGGGNAGPVAPAAADVPGDGAGGDAAAPEMTLGYVIGQALFWGLFTVLTP